MYYNKYPGGGNSTLNAFTLILSLLYATRLNWNYFRTFGWHCIGEEDWRYNEMHLDLEKKGIPWFWISLPLVFTSQWIIIWLGSFPMYAVRSYSVDSVPLLSVLGFSISLVGMVIEYFADDQLQNFIEAKKDKKTTEPILKDGLFKYSRHPNYFGQMLFWVGLGLISFGVGAIYWSLGVVCVPLLLIFYSVDAMDKRMLENKSREKAFREYMQTTSGFLLLPPKQK
eukprot:TRINITY_DN562_c0_g1_i2.p1 TRINITY_DN562_c0_g1~~TRINITY_DN562_c0_g1_i2.p1  ORF type:complete len:226 (-),score=50.91 TRINITY_DN562_c0_g1_i2:240-917(-)